MVLDAVNFVVTGATELYGGVPTELSNLKNLRKFAVVAGLDEVIVRS